MRIVVLGILLFLAACGTWPPTKLHGITPPDDPYRAALIKSYSEFAQQKQNDYDWWTSKYFAEKGLRIAAGEPAEPEVLSYWKVSEEYAVELRKARQQLINVLDKPVNLSPQQSANTLLAFDRWVVVASEGWNAKRIKEARDTFYRLLPKTKKTLKPSRPRPSASVKQLSNYEMGVAYFHGTKFPKDDAKALEYFRKSAIAGDADGQYSLAYMYSLGLGGVTQDWVEANNWLMKAANQGHAQAMDNLGVSYGDGRGITQDWVECYKWITLAARRGDSQAIKDLDYAKARMTDEQIKKATELADKWQ